jgi:hypothetical protein
MCERLLELEEQKRKLKMEDEEIAAARLWRERTGQATVG